MAVALALQDSGGTTGRTMGATVETLFATVAVDQPVDGTFTYTVPEAMRRHVKAGSRVTVPLGRGNRLAQATVLAVSAEAPAAGKINEKKAEEAAEADVTLFDPEGGAPQFVDAGGMKIKPLADVLLEVLPIPLDLLELARWIAVYYCAPIGMTLASMVPAAVKRGTRLPANLMIGLADAATPWADQLADKKISPKGRALFEMLHAYLAGGEKTEQAVLAHAQVGRPTLRRLVDMGLLTSTREIKLPEHPPVGAHLDGEVARAGAKELTADQEAAMAAIGPLVDTDTPAFGVRLLHGVTGSGKTEVYIRAIERVVARGKRAIVLVPEISLTPQAVKRFTARFPRVAVLHSGLKDSERHQHWHAIATGWAQVIVGARSAIFAPVSDLGLIVVDEEHDPSYKQDSLPKYHGRDVAIRRAQMLNIPILLGSATPALESWHNAHHHASWGLLSLRTRPLGTQMPRVVTVDMKQEAKVRRGLHILSTTLEHHLKQTLEQKKQAIFLLNRRGYAHYLMCPRCDWVLMCDNCDATMVVHRMREEKKVEPVKVAARTLADSAKQAVRDSVKKDVPRAPITGTVQCHYCLTSMMLPDTCPLCKARLTHLGQGTQRAEDELLRKFPDIRLKRMDSDSMSNLGEYQKTLDAFGRGEIDLLIGTQMISKGLDFPNVALVGVLNADLAMTIPDFRASERTFQLICQVAGRAGRTAPGGGDAAGVSSGTVIVQTYQPQEPAIAFACHHDYLGFVRAELPHRKEFGYPPYGRLVRIVLSHKGYTTVNTAAAEMIRLIYALTAKLELPVRVQGPFPPPMERLMELYRVEVILFAETALPLQRLIQSLRARGVLMTGRGAKVGVSVDVDPLHML